MFVDTNNPLQSPRPYAGIRNKQLQGPSLCEGVRSKPLLVLAVCRYQKQATCQSRVPGCVQVSG